MKKRTAFPSFSRTVIFLIVIAASLLCLFPFYWMILNSFKKPLDIFKVPVDIFTTNLCLDSYRAVFEYEGGIIWKAFLNSLLIASLSTLGTLFTSSMAAFAFAKLHFRGDKFWYGLFVSTLMIPGQVTLLPLFMVFSTIGWTDTFLPLIVPGVMINTYGVFLLRSYMVSLPDELIDAAKIDGCGYFRQYWNVVLPLSKAALVTLGLFSFIGSWNNYFGQLIYLTNENLITMPLFIAGLKETHMTGIEWGRIMAASTLSILPIGIIYLSCQKYFVQGIATTGLKE